MRTVPCRLFFPFAVLILLVGCAGVPTASQSDCPPVAAIKAERLFGRWSAHFASASSAFPERAELMLQRHAEFSDSLAGVVSRELTKRPGDASAGATAVTAALAGDLEDGVLILDESSDRVSITGTWNAEMVEGSCGTAFTGLWKDTSKTAPTDSPDIPFRLTKIR